MTTADAVQPPVVYQAQGMVSVQADCDLDRALSYMQEMADLTHTPLEEIANEVAGRRLQFHPRPSGVRSLGGS